MALSLPHDRMRVLFAGEQSSRDRITVSVIKEFHRQGAAADFVTVRPQGGVHDQLAEAGLESYSLNCHSSWDYPRASLRLRRLATTLHTDVIFAVEPIPAAIAGMARRALFAPVSVIFNRQHMTHPAWQQRVLSRFAAACADLVVCISEATAESARTLDRVPSERIRIVYNSIPELRPVTADETRALRATLGISDAEKVCVIVGRLRAVKGHRTLLEAVPLVEQFIGERLHVVIVGSGPEEANVKTAAAPLGDRIHMAGSDLDVARWYAIADVVAVPSYVEPFGLVNIEAMSLSRPVVASRVGGIPEIIEDGVSGLLVPPRDGRALATAIAQVLGDRDLASRLGMAGRQRYLDRFTIQKNVSDLIRCCEDAVRLRKNSAQAHSLAQ